MLGSLLRRKRTRRRSERRPLLPDTRRTPVVFEDSDVTEEDGEAVEDEPNASEDDAQPLLPIFSAAHLGNRLLSRLKTNTDANFT